MKMNVYKKPQEIEDDWVDDEHDVYSDKARFLLVEDDEMTPEEECFMSGYGEAE